MTATSVPVVIVGAGPTGITAATLLAGYGVDVLVLDRWEGVYPQPRAVHMDDESMRILARLGIADEFAAISRPALGLRLLDKTHRVLAEFGRSTDVGVHGYPQANMYDQPDLEHLLRTNLKNYPQAVLRGNVEVTDVTDDRRGRVRVTYTDRGTGTDHVVDADYVLGCDGANSLVRKTIGTTMTDWRFDQRWLVVDIATTADLGQWEGVHQVCDPVRAATYMRIGPTRYRWEFRLLPTESANDFAGLPALAPLIGPWTGGVDDRDLEVIRVAEYTFRARIADRWRSGPIFLLGDAAHLTPPFIGQGLCAGLRDAMNLAWKLAGVLRGDLPEVALDSYQAERKPHARYMIATALGMGKAMTAGGRLGDALRQVIAPRIHMIPGLRAKLVDGSTPALRRSACIDARRRLRPGLAGRLAPNVLLANGRRLDDVQGGGFAVITGTPPSGEQRAVIDARGARLVIPDPGTELAAWLSRGRAEAAVVRPDGTVMAAGPHLDTVLPKLPTFRPQEPR
ncbi:bifunctional 3-(3-hydroxy-phenyl)propionate/3-hydroxycinnamic acid hydroxylase [Mycolicibacterium cosmeticum]|uniref:bifunctional 3-(3-hydroxy-phenyl)propionate/3-hydroxycinnamic acid hydroxylase MhpA n=1 Tax=Mycolicibacterium cosmeticum TaxID=258533 RepID=UPI003204BB41